MQKIYHINKLTPFIVTILAFLSLTGFCQAPLINYSNNTLTYTVGSHIAPVFPNNTGGVAYAYGQTITIAGSGVYAYLNGAGTGAEFAKPTSVVTDASGNVYVADGYNGSIREISPAGVVTTFSGYGAGGEVNGSAGTARFNLPTGISFDGNGNLYVADFYGNVIRMVSPTGTASTLAGNGTEGYVDGPVATAEFNHPIGTVVDAAGNVYVADNYNNVIRKITPSGMVSTFAGNGTRGYADGVGTAAQFSLPCGLTIDASGNLYVADESNNVIRKITPTGVVSTYAGNRYEGLVNGNSPMASFFYPISVAVDATGNMYISDQYYSVIRKITPGGVVSTLAGSGTAGSTDGVGIAASFNNPGEVAVDATGNVYVADIGNNKIRKIITGAYSISPALPTGLLFDRATGGISGVPAAASPATTYTITAVNGQGAGSTTITLAVNPQSSFNPSQSQNYVATFTPRVALITNNSALIAASVDKNQVEIAVQYLDGLGRPMQTVQVKGSPTGRDVVQPIVYDQFGRDSVKYLPYSVQPTAASDGSYKTTALADQPTFYSNPTGSTWNAPGVVNNAYPVSGINYEPSPLNRVVEQGDPGQSWQLSTSGISGSGHTTTVDYESNDQSSFNPGILSNNPGSRMVALYTTIINSDESQSLARVGNTATYNTGTLYLTITRDENWNPASDGCLNTTEE